MKVLLAAASFSSAISGVQRHAFNVVRCLLTRPEISSVHLAVAPWQREMVKSSGLYPNIRLHVHIAEMDRGSLSRNLWYYRGLPALAGRLDADIVHLSYPAPLHAKAFSCPTVVTLHDLYPYEIPLNFGFPQVIFNRLILQQCLRSADSIACVSEITTLRLRKYTAKTVWHKALRISNCVPGEPQYAAEPPLLVESNQPFLLCVAQHRKNKNILLLLETFYRLLNEQRIPENTRLMIVGIHGPETSAIRRMIARRKLGERVVLLEGISDPELRWCYQHCESVLAPSITEGFGLPVAEALLAGARVVCSDIPAFREIGDGYCRFVALGGNVAEELADAIAASLHDRPQAPVELPQLSVPVIAAQYLDLYCGLLALAGEKLNPRMSVPAHAAATERRSL